MEGSRVRILNLLLQRKQATVEQLSQEMGLASATVRRHLDILQRDNLVAYSQVKKKTGRPEHTYFLTEAGQETLPKGYSVLLTRLVQKLSGLSAKDISSHSGDQVLRLLFQDMAKEASASYGINGSDPLERRVERVVAVLEGEQFLPHLEESSNGWRLRLHNCPFRSVAMENSSVCEYDHAMLTAMLGAKVERDTCIRAGDQGCCYVIPRKLDGVR